MKELPQQLERQHVFEAVHPSRKIRSHRWKGGTGQQRRRYDGQEKADSEWDIRSFCQHGGAEASGADADDEIGASREIPQLRRPLRGDLPVAGNQIAKHRDGVLVPVDDFAHHLAHIAVEPAEFDAALLGQRREFTRHNQPHLVTARGKPRRERRRWLNVSAGTGSNDGNVHLGCPRGRAPVRWQFQNTPDCRVKRCTVCNQRACVTAGPDAARPADVRLGSAARSNFACASSIRLRFFRAQSPNAETGTSNERPSAVSA